jgi:magnesium-transporting ATPase (P-type)
MYIDCQGTVVVAGRARAVVVGVGANTAMGSIRDSMLHTDDVSIINFPSLCINSNLQVNC